MTSDGDIRAALDGGTAFDPAFRVRVLQRICERARRRTAAQSAMSWIAAGVALGLMAQALTPADIGAPGLEAVVMTVSLGAAAMLLASLAASGFDGAARSVNRTLSAAARYLPL